MFSQALETWISQQEGRMDCRSFRPYPTASDRTAWTNVPASVRKSLIAKGEEFLHYQYPVLTATDFMDFTRTGNPGTVSGTPL